jgi:hypothetical protein
MVVHTCNLITQEAEAEESKLLDHPGLHSENEINFKNRKTEIINKNKIWFLERSNKIDKS